jgi:hypothetical protein
VEAEKKSRRSIPLWVWVLGCLGLLVVCAVPLALGAAGLAFFAVTDSQGGAAQAATVVESIEVEPGPVQPALSATPEALAPATSEPETSANPSATASPSAAHDAQATDEALTEVDDPFAAERAAIEASVVAIRELEPKEPVTPLSLTKEELRQRLAEDLLEDYEPQEARHDAIALSAFDFLPADFDLHRFVLDLLTEQIAGYYDPETDEFVIVSDDNSFGIMEQVTHAHEYVHALQDQYYNLELLDEDELESEAAFAVQALAEGEATFVQSQFMVGGYFEPEQLFELVEESLNVDTAILDSAPPVIARELEFPYLSGLEFVQALYVQGGYGAVDAAWHDLPQSTEHILHPDRYLAGDAPQLVSVAPLSDTLGAGWQLVDEDTLGEFYLREYLNQQLERQAVDQAATGWGGDRYAVYWNADEQSQVMVMKLVWDSPADAAEFDDLYPQYPVGLYAGASQTPVEGGRCWAGGDVLCLFSSESETLVVRAPDVDTAARVAAAQQASE